MSLNRTATSERRFVCPTKRILFDRYLRVISRDLDRVEVFPFHTLSLIRKIIEVAVEAVDKDNPSLLFPHLERVGLSLETQERLKLDLQHEFSTFVPLTQ